MKTNRESKAKRNFNHSQKFTQLKERLSLPKRNQMRWSKIQMNKLSKCFLFLVCSKQIHTCVFSRQKSIKYKNHDKTINEKNQQNKIFRMTSDQVGIINVLGKFSFYLTFLLSSPMFMTVTNHIREHIKKWQRISIHLWRNK